ncbi:MAG: hypothetical protein WC499_04275 [Patescibacteria group bacterium]
MKRLIWAELLAIIVTVFVFGIAFSFLKLYTTPITICTFVAAIFVALITLCLAFIVFIVFFDSDSIVFAFFISASVSFLFSILPAPTVILGRFVLFFFAIGAAACAFGDIPDLKLKKGIILISALGEIGLIWLGFYLIKILI